MKKFPVKFEDMQEEKIVEFAKNGIREATEYILEKYKPQIHNQVKPYFLAGAEKEDLVQEALIGLFEAIKDYKPDKSSFRYFANLCIKRQIVTAIRTQSRQKQIPLNSSISLNEIIYDDPYLTREDILSPKKNLNPEKKIITEETTNYLKKELKQILTDLEWHVLVNYLEEKSYKEIARSISVNEKTVDNALSRVKKKAQYIFISKTLGD